jgi:preprotein translocase subunit YajC
MPSVLQFFIARSKSNRKRKGMNMENGDKVKTICGNIETVMKVEACRVITFESACKNSWYHPTKVFLVYWSENIGRYVSVPED